MMMGMNTKAKAKVKAKAANVVDLATFRKTRTASASQESLPQPPRWTHIEAVPWCLTWFDKEPVVANMLNEWEVNFLEDMAEQTWPATERQNRCLNRIIFIIVGTLREQQQQQQQQRPPTPPDAA
jgi:hypothetical protein